MKHSGSQALGALASLREQLRSIPGLNERKPGIFYRGSVAFLHFHEDAAGLFADAKIDGSTFKRVAVSTERERLALVKLVESSIRHAKSRRQDAA